MLSRSTPVMLLIVLMSDLFDDPEAVFGAVAHFRKKMHEIKGGLVVVAFVQDEATKKILQSVYLKPTAAKTAK